MSSRPFTIALLKSTPGIPLKWEKSFLEKFPVSSTIMDYIWVFKTHSMGTKDIQQFIWGNIPLYHCDKIFDKIFLIYIFCVSNFLWQQLLANIKLCMQHKIFSRISRYVTQNIFCNISPNIVSSFLKKKETKTTLP